jgi:1-acyl-sn-glycerol-3-phosphate acyltransferase
MAKDLDIAVLPVTVLDTDTILPPDGIDLRPGHARMIVHAPIGIDEVRALSAGELRDRARGIIAAPLAE